MSKQSFQIFNPAAIRAGDIICGRGTAAISRAIMLRTAGLLSLWRGDSWSHDSGAIWHNGRLWFGDSHMGQKATLVDPAEWEAKCLAGTYRVLVLRPTFTTREQGEAAAWWWQAHIQGSLYDKKGVSHLVFDWSLERLKIRAGKEEQFWCTEGWARAYQQGPMYDPWAPKINPTPGTTRKRYIEGLFCVVPGALTKFGEQFMIRPPARRSAS